MIALTSEQIKILANSVHKGLYQHPVDLNLPFRTKLHDSYKVNDYYEEFSLAVEDGKLYMFIDEYWTQVYKIKDAL